MFKDGIWWNTIFLHLGRVNRYYNLRLGKYDFLLFKDIYEINPTFKVVKCLIYYSVVKYSHKFHH